MSEVHLWQVRCLTDNRWETVWDEYEPMTCPINNTHSINSNLTTKLKTVSQNVVKIEEETTDIGGFYQTPHPMTIVANAGETAIAKMHWPFDVSAYAVNYVSDAENYGDIVNMWAGDLPSGAITAPVTSNVLAWENRDYIKGEKVLYSDPYGYHDDNPRVYTCIANTVGNALPVDLTIPRLPANETYWLHGYELSVSDTVLEKNAKGYYLSLKDGANTSDMMRIIRKDVTGKKLYLESPPSHNFSPLSPTYCITRVWFIKDHVIDKPWQRDIGKAKIGGATIPDNVYVYTSYTNNSVSGNAKTFRGYVEIGY